MFDRESERYESFMMYASYGRNPMDIHFFDEDDQPRRQSFLDAMDEDEEEIDDIDEDDWDDFDEDEDEWSDDEDDLNDDVDMYGW